MSTPPNWWHGRTASEIIAIQDAERWYLDRIIVVMQERDTARAQAEEWQEIARDLRALCRDQQQQLSARVEPLRRVA